MTIAIIIVVLAIVGIIVAKLPAMRKHESCIVPQNKVDMSQNDIDFLIKHNVEEYVKEYIHGVINRTEMLQLITSDIQSHYSHAFGIDDREWDYIMKLDPHTSYLEKAPSKEVLVFNKAEAIPVAGCSTKELNKGSYFSEDYF